MMQLALFKVRCCFVLAKYLVLYQDFLECYLLCKISVNTMKIIINIWRSMWRSLWKCAVTAGWNVGPHVAKVLGSIHMSPNCMASWPNWLHVIRIFSSLSLCVSIFQVDELFIFIDIGPVSPPDLSMWESTFSTSLQFRCLCFCLDVYRLHSAMSFSISAKTSSHQ